MTDQTKQLFNAPWIRCRIEIEGKMQPCVSAQTNHTVAISFDEKDVARILRLPELYDALMDAAVQLYPDAFLANDKCRLCFKTQCKGREWSELLRKVRNGESVPETNKN